MLSLGGNIYYQPVNATVTANEALAGKDGYFAMFGPTNEHRWGTHFGGAGGLGPAGSFPNTTPDRADEQMADIAVLSGQRIYGFLNSRSAETPTQNPPPSTTGTPYYDPQFGGDNDCFLTAFEYAQYAVGITDGQAPARAMMLTAMPNPAGEKTRLKYSVGTRGSVSISITDALGRAVMSHTLDQPAGVNEVI